MTSEDDGEGKKSYKNTELSPPASPYLASLRAMGTRERLYAHGVGFGVLGIAFWACLSPTNYWALTATAASDPRTRVFFRFTNQTKIMLGLAAIILLSIAVAAGRVGVARLLGKCLSVLGHALKLDHKRYVAMVDRLRGREQEKPGVLHSSLLVVLVLSGWFMMFVLTQKTGGLTHSPFLQFAVSMFAWQLILATNERFKVLIFVASASFVLSCWLSPLTERSEQLQFSVRYFALITLLNMLFQLLPYLYSRGSVDVN